MSTTKCARIGSAIRWPWLALAIFGFSFCMMLPRLDAQPKGPAGLYATAAPALQKGQFAARIPKTMRRNASTLVKVTIWDKRADAQARTTLEADPLAIADVLLGKLLRVELAERNSGEFTIHAMTPAKQLLSAHGAVMWEWAVIPLKPGEHELLVVATNLADSSGKPLDLTVHSLSLKVEVTPEQGADPAKGVQKQASPTPQSSAGPAPQVSGQRSGSRHHPGYRNDVDSTSTDNQNGKTAAFFSRLKQALKDKWYPGDLLLRRDPFGQLFGTGDRKTVLQVQLHPDGRVADLKVVEFSGLDFLDEEAINAFRRAQPFDAPPSELLDSDGYVRFKYVFSLTFANDKSDDSD
jgi:TonB family protein